MTNRECNVLAAWVVDDRTLFAESKRKVPAQRLASSVSPALLFSLPVALALVGALDVADELWVGLPGRWRRDLGRGVRRVHRHSVPASSRPFSLKKRVRQARHSTSGSRSSRTHPPSATSPRLAASISSASG